MAQFCVSRLFPGVEILPVIIICCYGCQEWQWIGTCENRANLFKPRANGRNIVRQQLQTLLAVTYCVRLHTLLHVVECFCAKFETGKTFQPTTPDISFVAWSPKRSAMNVNSIRFHSSSNIVGATHAHYAWITKTYGLYSSHDALQVPNLLGVLRPFARSLKF